MSTIFKRMWQAFQDKVYRQVYAEGFSNSKIATQIKVLREQRGWTQQQLAEVVGMKQSRIATLEDVNYSSWSIRTLRRLAEAFDLWLDVELKEFGAVWPQLRDFNRESLKRRSFADDPAFKEGEEERIQTIQDEGVTSAVSSISTSQEKSSESTLGSALAFGLGHVFEQQSSHGKSQSRTNSGTLIINFTNTLARTTIESPSATQMILSTREHDETQTPHRRSGALAAIA